ncbi:J domain-containing protein [Brevibacillus brevis]|uniref:J domain-containing protein n=1 Tax=Brevibacillus brevis TaxID=1393 RepID=UPI001C8D16D2|nr:J domain-containing protein [Brevibacillus brevis]MBY0088174.1 tetratricopeptide repeat protein [Brevibacillus brevis]
MGIWEILGIEPTDNPAQIKKAYAKKLKVHNPEVDPEGFQRLREAYDLALKFTGNDKRNRRIEETPLPEKRQLDSEENHESQEETIHLQPPRRQYELWHSEPAEEEQPTYDPPQRLTLFDRFLEETTQEVVSVEETPIPKRYDFTESYDHSERSMNPDDMVERFFRRTQMLYDNYHERIQLENWRELLNDEAMWNVGCHQLIDTRFLYFLEEHYHLPHEVWKLLDSHFQWREKSEKLASQLSGRFVAYLNGQLNQTFTLRYHSFDNRDDLDIEAFLEWRSDALFALMENDCESAQNYLAKAHALYALDPDLIRLQGEYFLRTGNKNRAFHTFDQLIRLDPNNIDAYLCRARLFLEKGDAADAIKDCEEILTRMPELWDARSLLGKGYLQLGEWEKAQVVFQEMLSHNPFDIDAKIGLTQIHSPFNKRSEPAVNKQAKAARRKTLKALGLPGKLARFKQFFALYTRRNIWTIIFLLLLHYAMFAVVSMKLEMTSEQMFDSLVNKYNPVQLKTMDELKQTPLGYQVEFTLTKASYINLLRVYDTEKHPEPKAEFIPAAKAEERDLLNSETGYVNIGYLDQQAIIVITDYDHAKEIHDKQSITMRGTLKAIPDGEMLPVIVNALEKRKHPYQSILLTDMYINAKPDLEEKGWTGSWLLGILAMISMLYYIRIIREIPKTRKALTFH